MKTLLAVLLLACTAASAHEGNGKPENSEQDRFQDMKREMIKDMDARIGAMQKVRDCIAAATDQAGVKKCRDDEQAAMKAMMKAMKQERLKRIEQQQKELDKEKQQLQTQDDKQ